MCFQRNYKVLSFISVFYLFDEEKYKITILHVSWICKIGCRGRAWSNAWMLLWKRFFFKCLELSHTLRVLIKLKRFIDTRITGDSDIKKGKSNIVECLLQIWTETWMIIKMLRNSHKHEIIQLKDLFLDDRLVCSVDTLPAQSTAPSYKNCRVRRARRAYSSSSS